MKNILLAVVFLITGAISVAFGQDQITFEDTTGIFEDIQTIDSLIVGGQLREADQKINRYKNSNLRQVHPDAYYFLLAYSSRFHLITGQLIPAKEDGSIAYEAFKNKPFDSSRNFLIGRTAGLWYAYTLSELGEFQEAVRISNSMLEKLKDNSDRDKRPFRTVIADVYKDLGDYDLAIEIYTNLLEEAESDYNKAIFNNNIGLAYHDLEDYDLAITHFETAISINKKLNNVRDLASNYNNIYNSYIKKDQPEIAFQYARECLQLAEEHGLKSSEVRMLYNIADRHITDNQIDSAFVYLRKSLNISTELNIPEGIYFNNLGMGNAFYALNQFSQAKTHYEKAYEFAKAGGRKKLAMDALQPLYTLNEYLGEYEKAYKLQEEFINLKSDVLNEERLQTIESLKIQYDVAQKEREAEYLSQKVGLQEASLTMQNRISWILGFGFLLTGGFLAFIYQQKRKLTQSYNKIEEAGEVIQQQNETLEELDAEKNTLINIVAHDIRNPLNAIMGFIHLLTDDPELAKSEQVMQQVLNALEQTEFLVSDLTNLNYLESPDIGIAQTNISAAEAVDFAVSTVFNQAKNKNIEISTDVPADATIRSNSKYLTRICQNLLTNAIKFSESGSQVHVSGEEVYNYFELRITDQGPGFTEEDKKKLFSKYEKLSAKPTGNETGTGLGLYIVKTICNHLNINIDLESTPGNGSTFILQIPV